MRTVILFNEGWKFSKSPMDDTNSGEAVTMPHTWNAIDGQDGGNDYYRGKCYYSKSFAKPDAQKDEEIWLEFRGVNMVAEVFLNGTLLARHEGGYSSFRVNLTDTLQESNLITVTADNSRSRTVYPQKADFTFYGGIYRDVYLIIVPKRHFTLGYAGGPGIQVTPVIDSGNAEVAIDTWLENTPDGTQVKLTVTGGVEALAKVQGGHAQAVITISDVHLWDGVDDPYLYTAKAELSDGSDMVEARFGCRSISFDAEKGFFLNGRSYPLCGVGRHQDWEGVGCAVTPDMHRKDLELIKEMGANTIRLAHYQHDQYFYDLCDEAGMVIWAEIPYISEHMSEANENTVSQMTELVIQNYNHPSIICWGLSNEITSSWGVTDDLIENHRRLNDLCHKLDTTRPTTMAHVFMLPTDNELVTLPDICSYNLYYGWYLGDLEDNDKWLDDFHKKHPQTVVGLSEYGADANPQYQNAEAERGDYSESYQARYHEHMLAMWSKRPYIWAMHMWNMFDFAADGRDEGGKHGINQKGLVTFDRKIKKDAFYIYKAYLSKEPFVHICGKRYVNRPENKTEIKVYSNLPRVVLYVDGKKVAEREGDKVFRFEIPISGEHSIETRAGTCSDNINIKRVSEPNPDYVLMGAQVINWLDKKELEVKEGYYSIVDSLADIKKSPEGAALIGALMERAVAARGDVAQNVQIPEELQTMLDRMSLEKLLKQIGDILLEEDVVALNKALTQIEKAK